MNRDDKKILASLQRDARMPLSELAQQVGLSTSACHRRVRALEQAKIIEGYCARLNARALGLDVEVFVEISLNSQSQAALTAFEKAVFDFDQILECQLMSGQADYILRIAAESVGDYENIHRNCLSKLPGVAAMRSEFVLKHVKPRRGYPIN